ncbi:unnamed protein product [Polarella glacialis]|uniref:Uncharacterized protein n=1 Tax=Polarella glacialis TaxID=89957 RepID=A0A813M0N5_POLGL|nr:unnamed protein product [Polarella glacialis]
MIRFRRDSLFLCFAWWGGILPHLFYPAGIYLAFLSLTHLWSRVVFDIVLHAESSAVHSIGGFVMFLLVFRLNQCRLRYQEGKARTSKVFATLEYMVHAFCSGVKGGGDLSFELQEKHSETIDETARQQMSDLAVVAKVNCIRLSLALAISLVMHCWLTDAASSAFGEVDSEMLSQIIFLATRLESLLYQEEIELLANSLSITREPASASQTGSEPLAVMLLRWLRLDSCPTQDSSEPSLFRVEVNRYRLSHHLLDTQLFGEEDGSPRTIIPLPKVLLNLLLDACLQPASKKWGFPERMMNIFVNGIGTINYQIEEMTQLVCGPVPLSYVQLCRLLLFAYSIVVPLSQDTSQGITDNIVMPLFAFTTLYGIEVLSCMMENPLGDDELDLNLMSMIHSLEIVSQHAFDLSECGRRQARLALRRPLVDFAMQTQPSDLVRMGAETRDPIIFERFFSWKPMPSLVLEKIFRSHGHASVVHKAMLGGQGTDGLRLLLRKVLPRGASSILGLDSGLPGSFHPLGSNENSSDLLDASSDLIRDPRAWCHYLVLNRKANDCAKPAVSTRETNPINSAWTWSKQTQHELRGQPASTIFNADSERAGNDSPVAAAPCGSRCVGRKAAMPPISEDLEDSRSHNGVQQTHQQHQQHSQQQDQPPSQQQSQQQHPQHQQHQQHQKQQPIQTVEQKQQDKPLQHHFATASLQQLLPSSLPTPQLSPPPNSARSRLLSKAQSLAPVPALENSAGPLLTLTGSGTTPDASVSSILAHTPPACQHGHT